MKKGLGIGDWRLVGSRTIAPVSYKELEVWQAAMDLAEQTFRLSRSFPKSEEYRLASQLIRATISVPANIAEGHARASRKDYARFVSIARGSLAEAETLLMLAERMKLADQPSIDALLKSADQIGRMLNRLHRRLGTED